MQQGFEVFELESIGDRELTINEAIGGARINEFSNVFDCRSRYRAEAECRGSPRARDSLVGEHSSLFKQAHSLALVVIAHDFFCLFAGRFRVYGLPGLLCSGR